MKPGKSTCKYLKEIRRKIAEENGIALNMPECTYQGPCAGTCPQCEHEVRQLETELARRSSLGKAATIAGIAVTLATPATAQVKDCDNSHKVNAQTATAAPNINLQDTIRVQGLVPRRTVVPDTIFALRGKIIDEKTGEEIPIANILVQDKEGKYLVGTQSDMSGQFAFKTLPQDAAKIQFRVVGYHHLEVVLSSDLENNQPIIIKMKSQAPALEGVLVTGDIRTPVIDIGAPSTSQTIERDGLKVKVIY
ncbi:MAG: carboxypeptidase-like regulatory domain-containing protein [Bacteroidales bacterium]|nr:carboxypeptidase-like regulatory domain-containing protein [Bacteroidales bacterium]